MKESEKTADSTANTTGSKVECTVLDQKEPSVKAEVCHEPSSLLEPETNEKDEIPIDSIELSNSAIRA